MYRFHCIYIEREIVYIPNVTIYIYTIVTEGIVHPA